MLGVKSVVWRLSFEATRVEGDSWLGIFKLFHTIRIIKILPASLPHYR